MSNKWLFRCTVGLATILAGSIVIAEPKKPPGSLQRSVTAITTNNHNGAWIGYSDGTVRYCIGGGGKVVPLWTNCIQANSGSGVAVTAISENNRRAWIGFANGDLLYCKAGGSSPRPSVKCANVND
ncbi:MAG: hypothetical protein KAS48_00300 [Gammaproteobacteria bacterium]|nr:hypothetical protein [Gammaproteobacteria bacterium]